VHCVLVQCFVDFVSAIEPVQKHNIEKYWC
jgi:hypothetical protein